jgi:hypothetical protein
MKATKSGEKSGLTCPRFSCAFARWRKTIPASNLPEPVHLVLGILFS